MRIQQAARDQFKQFTANPRTCVPSLFVHSVGHPPHDGLRYPVLCGLHLHLRLRLERQPSLVHSVRHHRRRLWRRLLHGRILLRIELVHVLLLAMHQLHLRRLRLRLRRPLVHAPRLVFARLRLTPPRVWGVSAVSYTSEREPRWSLGSSQLSGSTHLRPAGLVHEGRLMRSVVRVRALVIMPLRRRHAQLLLVLERRLLH